MARGLPSLLRLGLLAFCICVVGTLIGFSWEEALVPPEPAVAPSRPAAPLVQRSGGLSAAEREVIRRATTGLRPYKEAELQVLAADYLRPGSPMAVAWFTTRDTPEQVLAFYRAALLEDGFPVVHHRYNANAGYVGYMEPQSEELHLVSVLAQGPQTAVFVSSGQIAPFLEDPAGAVPSELPMPSGAQQPVVMTFQEEDRIRYSVMAEVRGSRVEELAAFYTRVLQEQRWSLDRPAEHSEGQVLLTAHRGAVRMHATLQPRDTGARLYVILEKPR